MSTVVDVQLSNSVSWRLRRTDPSKVAMASRRGWWIINPLCRWAASGKTLAEIRDERCPVPLGNDEVWLCSHNLMLVCPGAVTSNQGSSELLDGVRDILRMFRHQARQYWLGRTHFLSFEFKLGESVELDFPEDEPSRFMYQAPLIEAAVTWDLVEKIASAPTTIAPAPYEDIFLDALESFGAGDYRSALLYSALATEIAASTRWDEVHKAACTKTPPPSHLRIVSIDGCVIDPVYKRMQRERSSFRDLLHERPLYLEQRSLLLENKPLFDRALKLYGTRNAISHSGVVQQPDNSRWPIDEAHARLALQTAKDVFRWLGVRDDFHLPPKALMREFLPPPAASD